MLKVVFMRHGHYDWQTPDNLSSRGVAEVLAAVQKLKAVGIEPERIVSTPVPRGKETAQIVADKLGGKLTGEIIFDPKLDETGNAKFLRSLQAMPDGVHSIFAVSHAMTISEMMSVLLTKEVRSEFFLDMDGLPHGGVAIIDVEGADRCADIKPNTATKYEIVLP